MKPAAGKKANPEARPTLSARRDRPRRARLLLILALLAALAVAFAGWSWVAGLDRRQGLQLAAQSRFAEAKPFLERALAHRPRDWEVVKVLALGQLDADEVTEAEGLLTQWSELRPGDAEPFKRRLELHLRQRKFPQALEDGRRILELEPENIQIGKQVGPLYLITGQLEEAERECRRWLRQEPENPDLLYLLSDICHQRGNNAEAETALDRLLGRNPDSPSALLLRGILYEESDKHQQAIDLLQKVVAMNLPLSQQLAARYHLSLALARTGQDSEARRVMAEVQWNQAVDLMNRKEQPKVPGLLLRVAEAMLGVGKSEEAVELLGKILEQDPNCEAEAVRLLEKANSAAAHGLLAMYFEKQGQDTKAREHRRLANPNEGTTNR